MGSAEVSQLRPQFLLLPLSDLCAWGLAHSLIFSLMPRARRRFCLQLCGQHAQRVAQQWLEGRARRLHVDGTRKDAAARLLAQRRTAEGDRGDRERHRSAAQWKFRAV